MLDSMMRGTCPFVRIRQQIRYPHRDFNSTALSIINELKARNYRPLNDNDDDDDENPSTNISMTASWNAFR